MLCYSQTDSNCTSFKLYIEQLQTINISEIQSEFLNIQDNNKIIIDKISLTLKSMSLFQENTEILKCPAVF